jgi:uncharacterized protein (UPF0305 family)
VKLVIHNKQQLTNVSEQLTILSHQRVNDRREIDAQMRVIISDINELKNMNNEHFTQTQIDKELNDETQCQNTTKYTLPTSPFICGIFFLLVIGGIVTRK